MRTLRLKTIAVIFSMALIVSAGSAFAQTDKANHITEEEPITNSLSKLSQLEPLMFKYSQESIKKMNLPSGLQFGFRAEDVQKVLPEVVKSENKMIPAGKNAFRTRSVKNVDLESLIPVLVGSIQEQQAEIEKLKREIQSLKSMASAGN